MNNIEVSGTIHHMTDKPDTIKVKLMKMSKGWQWEITYEHTDSQKLLDQIGWLDNKLKETYKDKEA